MASFVRAARQTCRLFSNARPPTFVRNTLKPPACFISTSKKNKEAATISEKIQTPSQTEDSLEAKDENWISYGYSLVDREQDEWAHHMVLLFGVTLTLVGGAYFLAYYPDLKQRDWTQREAYLELARREKEGLPLIDSNLIDTSKIDLPSDDELGDFNIVI